MEKRHLGFELTVYENMDELSAEDRSLMQAAVKAREDAYAPYSNFKVGAAVLLDNGEMILGNNQENASFPAGLCAERVAIFHAGAIYPTSAIKAVAINVGSKDPAAPCGSCRQSMLEYEQRHKSPIAVLLMGSSGVVYKCNSITDILPLSFDSSYL